MNHDGVLPDAYKTGAVYAYALIAYVLWPVFVPCAACLLEPERRRRIIILIYQAMGLCVGLTLLHGILRDPLQVSAGCCRLSYQVGARDLLTAPYLAAVSIPFLASSRRRLVLFGLAVTALAAAAALAASASTFPSVWCFFAAVLSAGLVLHFRTAAQTTAREVCTSASSAAVAHQACFRRTPSALFTGPRAAGHRGAPAGSRSWAPGDLDTALPRRCRRAC